MKLMLPFFMALSTLLFGQDTSKPANERLESARYQLDQKKPTEALAILTLLKTEAASLSKTENLTLHQLLGQAYSRLQQYENAARTYDWALSNLECSDTLRAMFHYQLGLSRYRLSEYPTATDNTLKAKDLYKKIYGTEDKNYTACLNTLGFLYNVQAKYSDAEKTFQEARQINLRLTGGEDMQYARIINNLADVYCNLNRYDQADELYQTSLRIKEKISGRQSRDYANTLYNLAEFQSGLGKYGQAKTTVQEGIAIFTALNETNHPDYLKFLDFLAILTEKIGDVAEAERLFKDALGRREAAGSTKQADYAINLLMLGRFYQNQDKANPALPLVEKALPLFATIYGTSHPNYAEALTTLADIQSKRGENDRAKTNYEEAIRIVQRSLGKDHIGYFNAQFAYARFLRKTGKKSEAIAIYKKIDKIPQQYLKRAARFLSEKELNEKVEEYRSFSTEIYSFLREMPDDAELTGLAYNAALYYRGFILDNLQRIRQGMLKARKVNDARDEVVSLHRQLENEMNRPLEERGNTAALERSISELESEIARTLGSFAKGETEPNWEAVQMALGQDEAVVEYLAFADPAAGDSVFYGALLLTSASDAPAFVRLCREAQFSSLLPANAVRKSEYISGIYDFTNRGAVPLGEKKQSLTDLLWRPVQQRLPGTKRAYVVPDGLLHRIALSALPTSLETVVADSMELVLLGSSRQVIPSDQHILAYSGKNALVVGGVAYESKPGDNLASRSESQTGVARKHWDYLPWAEKESQDVAGLLKGAAFEVNYLDGMDANEKTVTEDLENSKGWRVLHVATHGFFSANSDSTAASNYYGSGMTNSGLVLAGANEAGSGAALPTSQDDGLLTAYELSRLDLSQTELVVLSACETALGDLKGAEGVYGLQRAFRQTGAGKLIMSLWQVPDRETKDFMVSFYKNWLSDKSTVREAFRKTQAECRQRFVNPYQWAGFVLLE